MLTQRSTGGVIAVEVSTGGVSYVTPPAVSFSGGGGTGAAGVASLSGGAVQGVVITNAGTGYSSSPTVAFTAATGTGAAGTAYVYTGAASPICLFQGRSGEVYGVDGMGRGIRVDCGATQATPIGVAPPSTAPAVTAASTVTGRYVASIHLTRAGAGYAQVPTVTLTGGTPSRAATATARMANGEIQAVDLGDRGSGYQAAPAVSFGGGYPSGTTLGVTVSGGVDGVQIVDGGVGYSVTVGSPPEVQFSTAQGLTGAYAIAAVDEVGRIGGIQVLAAGTGATTTGVTAEIVGGGGGGAALSVDMLYTVTGVTVINGGTGQVVPPVLTFAPAAGDQAGAGASAEAAVSGGAITSVTVRGGGAYRQPPTVGITDTQAEAVAVLEAPVRGTYLCAYRFLDSRGIPSNISHLTEVSVPGGADSLTWTLSHSTPDARVSKIELWRTTADQAVVLYRVATVDKTTTTYTDSSTDVDLTNTKRAEFGFMPITLPSGQLNARRFGVPPGNYKLAVMFQDRAWFAGDTTGTRPNSLLFSEVDEPESVPVENELLLQENAGEHDSIVGLLPMGSELLIIQTGHLYSLRYVAQPVLDASVSLVAYRGALNNACAAVMNGVAFLADSYGLYAFDGRSEKALSAPVDNFWSDGIIDFSKSAKFHVSTDYNDKVVRFHYCRSSDTEPVRALCFCAATETWWEEEYPIAVTASAPLVVSGKRTTTYGSAGVFRRPLPGPDAEGGVAWRYRSGNMLLDDSPSRSVGVVYDPTPTSTLLNLSLHYNGSTQARSLPVATDRGSGWVTGATVATLDMAATRSPLGPASGYAQAMFAGRLDPRSAGADRHLAVAFAGTAPVVIHGVTVDGVT